MIHLCASLTEGTALDLWDLSSGAMLRSMQVPLANAQFVRESWIVGFHITKCAIQIWDWKTQRMLYQCSAPERLTVMAVSPDGSYLAGGSPSGKSYLWDLSAGILLATWASHYKAVNAMVWTSRGHMLITGGGDSAVAAFRLRDILNLKTTVKLQSQLTEAEASKAPYCYFKHHRLAVTAVVCCGDRVFSAAMDSKIYCFDLISKSRRWSRQTPTPAMSLAVDPGECLLFAGCANGQIIRISLLTPEDSSMEEVDVIKNHETEVTALVTGCLDGRILVSGDKLGNLALTDVLSGSSMAKIKNLIHTDNAVRVPAPVRNLKSWLISREEFGIRKVRKTGFPVALKKVVVRVPKTLTYRPVGTCPKEPMQENTEMEFYEEVLEELLELDGEVAGSSKEVTRLRREVQRWKQVHSELHDFTMKHVDFVSKKGEKIP